MRRGGFGSLTGIDWFVDLGGFFIVGAWGSWVLCVVVVSQEREWSASAIRVDLGVIWKRRR